MKNYLILIGAPKCGTTSLASWLGSRPDAVLAKNKETAFFTDFAHRKWSRSAAGFVSHVPRTFEAFEAEFAAKPDAPIRIEASTDNFSCDEAPVNIARFAERKDVGYVRIVAVVRDPFERIVSEYEHTLRLGFQSGRLLTSLQLEEQRTREGCHPLFRHIHRSRYATKLGRYRKIFGDDLLILDYHRIGEDAERRRLLRFAGLDDASEQPALEHKNGRHVYKRPYAVRLMRNRTLRALGQSLVPQPLRPAVRRLLTGPALERYQPDEQEVSFIRRALGDEIRACIESRDIPTDRWSLAAAA